MLESVPNSQPALTTAARRNWPWYAPAWVFPVVLLVAFTAQRAGKMPNLFAPVWMPAFVVAFFRASVPEWRGRATRRETMVWGMLAPFLIWVGAVFVRIVLLAVAGRSDLI